MKSKGLKGFGIVFKHNLRIHMNNIRYIVATIAVALVFMIGVGLLVFFLTKSEAEKDKYDFNAEQIYVIDETGAGAADYATLCEMLGFDYVKDTKFTVSDQSANELLADDSVEYVIIQTKDDDEYVLQIITGKSVDTGKKQVKKNLECMEEFSQAVFQNHIYMTSGLTLHQVVQVLLPVDALVEEIGNIDEGDNENKMLVTMLFTVLLLLVTYFIVCFYGAGICADVPMEKTSKLVEQLLMSVSPYALISGKVLAMIASCLIQFLIWVASIFGGIFGGDLIVRSVYDIDESFISMASRYLSDWLGGQGFTAGTIVLAVIHFMIGFVVYLLLAGLGGAMLSKPEEASNVQTVFMLPLMIAYFSIFFLSGAVDGNDMPLIFNMIPFTSAMTAPSSVLLGSLSIPFSLLSIMVSVLCCMLELYIAAKVYEGLLFFNGNKLKLKDVVKVFKH